MKFGIWFEPEMISEDSELFRAHPEWAISIPGRKPMRSRYQLVLDMANPEVVEYLYRSISKILRDNHIEYVKWDMNRSILTGIHRYFQQNVRKKCRIDMC